VRAADNVHSAGTHVQIKTGGKLVILSGNNWTKAHTPRNSWLGGFLLNGEPLKTLDAFKHAFKRSFKLEHVEVRTRGNQQCRRVACVDVCNGRHNMCVAQPCKVACCVSNGALHTQAADRSGTEWLWTLQDLPRVIRKGDRRLEIVVLEASVWTKLG
jgi:hypothetical protein